MELVLESIYCSIYSYKKNNSIIFILNYKTEKYVITNLEEFHFYFKGIKLPITIISFFTYYYIFKNQNIDMPIEAIINSININAYSSYKQLFKRNNYSFFEKL